jgi:hypothetical protein
VNSWTYYKAPIDSIGGYLLPGTSFACFTFADIESSGAFLIQAFANWQINQGTPDCDDHFILDHIKYSHKQRSR